MGGSGGRGFNRVSPDRMGGWVKRPVDEVSIAEHDSRINAALRDLLAQYNDRDVDLVRDRLDTIRDALEDSLDMTIDLRFGGSIAKRTAIDGLSDVDAIGIL
ncbi:MAG: hypothetical protein H8E48_08550 [Chloroflexi bacterium]|nr:hypothetical protein [Chloroflexota bacterium]